MPEERIGLFAGSFDPLTLGHVDIVKKALNVFSRIIVLVADDPLKHYDFSPAERMKMVEETFKDYDSVEVRRGEGLTSLEAKKLGCCALIRGLRAEADFNSEFRMAKLNSTLAPGLETVFFISDPSLAFFSSTSVKVLYRAGADVSKMVSPAVLKELEKLKTKN